MNILLFVSVIVHVALMPFKRPHHNYLEIASLIINFVLFGSSSYFASGSDTGMSSLALVVDIIRCVACVVLVTVGVVENMACCRHDQQQIEVEELVHQVVDQETSDEGLTIDSSAPLPNQLPVSEETDKTEQTASRSDEIDRMSTSTSG